MEYKILTQSTPNPNARKFLVAKDVKTTGKVSFSHPAECLNVPLASALLALPTVTQVHLFENVITVNQNDRLTWDELEPQIRETIQKFISDHDPNFVGAEEPVRQDLPEDVRRIEEVLDRTIRPGLQADGGDVQVMEVAGNLITIRYEGACGSCPSSRSGTLEAIQSILRTEINEEIEIAAI